MSITAATLRFRIGPVACGACGYAGELRRPDLGVQSHTSAVDVALKNAATSEPIEVLQ